MLRCFGNNRIIEVAKYPRPVNPSIVEGFCEKVTRGMYILSRILTPELIVVAAAQGLPAAVSGLTDVALVVHTFTVQ